MYSEDENSLFPPTAVMKNLRWGCRHLPEEIA